MKRLFLLILFIVGLATHSAYCATPIFKERPSHKAVELPDLERDPGMFFLLAEQAEAQGDTEAVLLYIRKALALDPTSAYLNTKVATILARRSQNS